MQRKIQKKSFVSEIIVSESVALNILYKEDNNCRGRSMCKQTVLRFRIALRWTFPYTIMFTGMNKYGKGSSVPILTVFGPFCHFFVEETSKTIFYRHLSNHLFPRR